MTVNDQNKFTPPSIQPDQQIFLVVRRQIADVLTNEQLYHLSSVRLNSKQIQLVAGTGAV